jgi:hypothetical protein
LRFSSIPYGSGQQWALRALQCVHFSRRAMVTPLASNGGQPYRPWCPMGARQSRNPKRSFPDGEWGKGLVGIIAEGRLMATRFVCYIPGFWRTRWLKIRYPKEWSQKVGAIISDTRTGYCFQVTEEEDALMTLAGDASSETPTSKTLASRRQLNRALELMSDELFLAMHERRQGDETAWVRFAGMSRDDWRVWWAGLEAQACVEARRAN